MRFPRAAAVVAAAAVTLTSAGLTAVAHAARTTSTLTVLSTTDVHGHVYNWDYFQDAEFSPDTTGRNSASDSPVPPRSSSRRVRTAAPTRSSPSTMGTPSRERH